MDLLPISKQVAAIRRRLRMEQRALEPLTGLKQPHVARIEGGKDVRLSTLEKLVRALGAALVVVPRDRLAEVQALLNTAPGDTCLLYTSPSPRDKRQSRMPSSA